MIVLNLPLFWHKSVVWHLRLMSISLILTALLFTRMRFKVKIQTSVIDIDNYCVDDKIFVYHGLTRKSVNFHQINFKISPLKGLFTFDPKGYAGFGLTAKQRRRWLGLSDAFVQKRSCEVLKRNYKSKYKTSGSIWRGEVPDIILVEQLEDDKVSDLRNFNDSEMEQLVSEYCRRHKLTWAWRRHPFSLNGKKHGETDIPLDIAIEKNVVFVTHNSGLGCEVLHKKGKVIFCAENEFVDKSFVFGNCNDRSFDFYFRNEFQKEQFKNFQVYLGTLIKWSDIGVIKNLLLY